MKVNLIYHGEGVSKQFLSFLIETFQKLGPVQLISPSQIIDGKWIDHTFSLIMPGGRDLPYQRDLKGEGNRWIQTFVQQGGRYIGICAGAYYASSHVEFAKGSDLQILEERELKFFQGKAVGPILGNNFTYDGSGITLANISYREHIQGQFYYHGGPAFVGNPQCKVLATYCDVDHLPAMIVSTFGLGKVLLSGIHFEYPLKDHLQEKIRQAIVSDLINVLCNRT